MAPPLPRSTKLWYGLGQAAQGIKDQAFGYFLLFYYTQVVGLSGWLAGQAVLIALVFDALSDPIAGVFSDRLHSRWGRRHPFMYAAALPVAVCFYFTFAPPSGLGQAGLFAWLTLFAVLTRLMLTLFFVPHLALGAELSADYEERTRIVAIQHVFSVGGAAAGGALGLLVFMRPTAAYADGQLNPAAYAPFALSLAVGIFATILLSAWRTHWRIPFLPQPQPASQAGHALGAMLDGVREAFRIRSFRALFLGTLLVYTAWGVTTSLGLHLGTYFWRATTDQLFLWGVANYTGTFLGLAYWPREVSRLDKKPVFIRGMAAYAVFLSGAAFAKLAGLWPAAGSPADIPLFIFTTGFLAHFALAATMVTGRSMMADVTDEDELRHGRRREGIFFGAVSFSAKAFFGFGSQIAGVIVGLVGLEPRAKPDEVSAEVARGLGLSLGLSILFLAGLSLAFFSRYDISRARQAAVRTELDRRG
ncbi:MAG: MFS transporter [Myxococcota bacterium]